ncbi:unnamed protein product [Calicophoron daubneyi]|uniref:Protein FRA10AC1 n=1 Tax=Calicophoron daubneyi TaxID=300641 RepID=A0AAV2T2E0_CALDB
MKSKRHSEIYQSNEYVSDYESETSSVADTAAEVSKSELHPLQDAELTAKPGRPRFPAYGTAKSVFDDEQRRAHNAAARFQFLSMDAFDRHKKLVNDYLQYYGGKWSDFKRDESKDRRDIDVIREHGRFLWSEKDEPNSWSERLAKRYWDKLFKEYCLVDLSRYKENKFGMRWRLEKEVISGKGQFTCGNVCCAAGSDSHLRSWEVNFCYKERGERRNALVKLRLCPECSDKLNYRHKRRDVTSQSMLVRPSLDERHFERDPGTSEPENESGEPYSKKARPSSEGESTETRDLDAVWRTSVQSEGHTGSAPKSQDEEFDEYLSGMLL